MLASCPALSSCIAAIKNSLDLLVIMNESEGGHCPDL